MIKEPLVSIVMSVYNCEEYLDESINSILEQTYTNFEFIIINDGSTDSSLDIIRNHMKRDNRIFLISRNNKGLPYSLNEGIKRSNGKYILRMDSDDISLINRIEEQVKFMEENIKVGVCGTYVKFFGKKNEKVWKPPLSNKECKITLLIGSCFAHPSVIIRKSILDTNDICYDNNMYTAQDYALWLSLIKSTMFANIPKVLLLYREVENSISTQAKKKLDNKFHLVSKYIGKNLDCFNLNNNKNKQILFSLLINKSYLGISNKEVFVLIVRIIKINKNLNLYEHSLFKSILIRKLIVYNLRDRNYKYLLRSLFLKVTL